LLAGVAEGCRPGIRATMQELAIFSRCWNVPYHNITAPVLFWQGLNDRNVPVAAALQLAKLIPDCRAQTIRQAGHYWIFDNIGIVLKEISRVAQGNQNAHKTGVTNP
jgi:pimeloyl-ACP methyl ester carboxylesterase